MSKSFNSDYFGKRTLNQKLRNDMYYNDLKYIEKNLKKEFFNNNLYLLDIGCSDGKFTKLLMQKFGVIADGIEINKEQANKAKNKLIKIYNKIDSTIPFQKYDVIIMRGTIHYLSSNEINLILTKANKKCIIILLQNLNSNSIPFHVIGPKRILFATPSQDFDGNTIFYNRKNLLDLFDLYNFNEVSFNYPYLSTPYRKLFSDFIGLLLIFNPWNKNNYDNAFFRNVFRAIYIKDI